MAATDTPFRKQRTLDYVFAASCILLLLSTVWMFSQDYNREWKAGQRQFRDVEEAVAQRAMLAKLPDKEQIDAATAQVKEARSKVDALKDDRALQREISRLQTAKAKAEANAANIKADYDSTMSLYDIEVEKAGEVNGSIGALEGMRKSLQDRKKKLDEAQAEVERAKGELREKQRPLTEAEEDLARAEADLKRLSGDLDRWARTVTQKRWWIWDSIRNLPVLDGFAAPVKIQQYVLEDLPIDYAFKMVPRYDRCTTCHQGIDRANFDVATLHDLREPTDEQKEHLREVKDIFKDRRSAYESQSQYEAALGFDPDDLPGKVREVKLSAARIKQYAAHPRLDLFVDGNSPHPVEKFGCTICHSGQGSATDFVLASHTPNDHHAEEHWQKEYGWASNHYWDFPMLPNRFVESSCIKCHHQVLDLANAAAKSEKRSMVHAGDKGSVEVDTHAESGPGSKVVRGYQLVRENGCFGCHEIAGNKGGRPVGPDLRLEPNTPLEEQTPAEQTAALRDPPGNLRKVGPSLYRLREKTNVGWVQEWLAAPRGFRPNTKMPHFYNLSTNRPEVLPDDQKAFPDAEMHAIAYYLIEESGKYLNREDFYLKATVQGVDKAKKDIERLKGQNQPTEQKDKELAILTARLELQRRKAPTALGDTVKGSDDNPVAVPLAPGAAEARQKQVADGRQLFTIKGCLACHAHKDTPVASDANFGPDLSRLAAKIAPPDRKDPGKVDTELGRRWLVQWVLNPQVHSPRTRMPVTHLTPDEAAAIAAWLLSVKADDWERPKVAEPTSDALRDLARVYLGKVSSLTRSDVTEILSGDANGRRGLTAEQIAAMDLPPDADERMLQGPLTDARLKWYVGKKSIGRLGCYGCHNVPGFENAKPIGTPLNDWGKKDGERLAFEDIVAYVRGEDNHVMLDGLGDFKDKPVKEGQEPFEKYFLEALEHHQRDGFLYQKLAEPRSYDYNRIRAWDDRLRMPQFRFARGQARQHGEETKEQAEAREELEAREAVMTFVLGLVAEPVPLKNVYTPRQDRSAEIRGLHVLEKYNCGGCHHLKDGTYEFRTGGEGKVAERLQTALRRGRTALAGEHTFDDHNAWVGAPQPRSDRVVMHGFADEPRGGEEPPEDVAVRLSRAVRVPGGDIPAFEDIRLPREELIGWAPPLGGDLVERLVPYLSPASMNTLTQGQPPRSVLPPPLLREGERVQPGWLFQFLRNPTRIRPLVVLRMPRFNMSEDEAMALVNYFAAVDRLTNPAVPLTYPYLTIPQHDEGFWRDRTQAYVKSMPEDSRKKRLDELKPLWEQAKVQNAEAQWREKEAYATDAYRLLANYNLCLQCHQVGEVAPKQPIGPALEPAAQRLRPDWTGRFIANPKRMYFYPSGPANPMPPNFDKTNDPGQGPYAAFHGTMREQAGAVRDVLMDFPRVVDLPANRLYRPPSGDAK